MSRLGEGTFGKCIQARLAHLNTCIKVFKDGAAYESTFAVKGALLSHCCYANLPWLYAELGVTRYKSNALRNILLLK